MDTQHGKDVGRPTKQDTQPSELAVQRLEERVTPRLSGNHNETLLSGQRLEERITPRLAGNHNESLLVDF